LKGFVNDGSGQPARFNPNNIHVRAATSATTVPMAAPTKEYLGINVK